MFFRYLGKYQLQVFSHILQGTFSLSSLSFLSLSSESCLVPQATLELLSSSNPPASGILGLQQALLLLTILSVFVHTFVPPPPIELNFSISSFVAYVFGIISKPTKANVMKLLPYVFTREFYC